VRRMLTLLGLLAVLWCVGWLAVIAHGFQEPEGAMGTLPLPAVTTQIGPAADWTPTTGQAAPTEFVYRVTHEHTFDFRGVQFFQLRSANGSATISVDGDVTLAETLKAADGAEITVSIRRTQPKVLQEVKR
jgi:hypothetical protein